MRISSKTGLGVKKGAWTAQEDTLLRKCIEKYGEGKWHLIPLKAGLNRCRKSCRLRWLNYLRPNIKRGGFEEDEVDLMVRLHKLLGNRWSLIAGRIPGRTANDVKNYWNTHFHKKGKSTVSPAEKYELENFNDPKTITPTTFAATTTSTIVKPQARTITKTPHLPANNPNESSNNETLPPSILGEGMNECWDYVFAEYGKDIGGQVGWSSGGVTAAEEKEEESLTGWCDFPVEGDLWDDDLTFDQSPL